MSGGGRTKPVKVVIINTKYVETDATSFKSVVQSLTGKDSKVEADCDSSPGYGDRRQLKSRSAEMIEKSGKDWLLMRDLSFKEFDRLLKEMPTVDELCGFLD
ncbi:hypothetical protein SLE2022_312370 [Rubroshorea leprosula]|uniref:VQ domain-containing protein n=1 Tax=Rubroshorea leprosula TaxID=152421 RepID=A0AAV5LBP1_9ROSI|nr:hypothetical protein SLEP1_g42842 [Rubroshorea leprosula]